jgi:hypothetical protein
MLSVSPVKGILVVGMILAAGALQALPPGPGGGGCQNCGGQGGNRVCVDTSSGFDGCRTDTVGSCIVEGATCPHQLTGTKQELLGTEVIGNAQADSASRPTCADTRVTITA